MYHIPREVRALFIRLCHTFQAIKGRKSTQKIIHLPIIPAGVGLCGQANLVDLLLSPDDGYKFILNYQDCFLKFIVLRPLRSKTADEVAQCLVYIFGVHGPPHILHTTNGTEFANKTMIAILHKLWSGTRTADRVIQKIREVLSVLMPISRIYSEMQPQVSLQYYMR